VRSGVPVVIAALAIVATTTGLSVLIAEGLRRTPLRAALGLARGRPNDASAAAPAERGDLVPARAG
jgi:hypothetical protein